VDIVAIDEVPIADAGPDITIHVGDTIDLNGSASRDDEGGIITWRWVSISHPNVPGLLNSHDRVAYFSPEGPGTYRFTLRVQDEAGQWSEPDELTVTVLKADQGSSTTTSEPGLGFLAFGILIVIVVIAALLVIRGRSRAGTSERTAEPMAEPTSCPDCGSPLDTNNDFRRPYCWRCDRYL
jgi:hypothetical protein